MALTSRQAFSKAVRETANATHFVVRFAEDQAVSMIPATRIVDPAPSTLKVSSVCLVKWSDRKTYEASVLAMGDEKAMRKVDVASLMTPSQDKENSSRVANTPKRRGKSASKKPPAKKRRVTTAKKYNYKQPTDKFVMELGSPASPLNPPVSEENQSTPARSPLSTPSTSSTSRTCTGASTSTASSEVDANSPDVALSSSVDNTDEDVNESSVLSISSSDSEIRLDSSKNVITVLCTEDVSTQTTEPVTSSCCCAEVKQKLDQVLDYLKDLSDNVLIQMSDLDDVRKRVHSIEKHMENQHPSQQQQAPSTNLHQNPPPQQQVELPQEASSNASQSIIPVESRQQTVVRFEEPPPTPVQPPQPPSSSSVRGFPGAETLVTVRINSSSRRNFAKNVAILAYSEEERKVSNVKGAAGKKQLSPNRMDKVRLAVFSQYPLDGRENEKAAWADCVRAIDEAGRKLNSKKK